ncbi:MAG: LacI family DNA-binding transcriptional regulator [Hyphomicrobiales bacterium]|nr:LacI family DNA-binding transcriptional regulator [Hyphomicrobiales bacterium]
MRKTSKTSYDVAKAAGVSQSAVSRAFSPTASIADKTRKHILKVAREMGYQPNAIARSMSSARSDTRQRSGIVGVIVTRLQDPFFANTIANFSSLLQAKGWHMLLFTIDSPSDVDDALFSLMQFKIDGVIILSAILSEHMAETCRSNGTPVMLYNRGASGEGINSVQIDNYAGGQTAAEVLLEAEHDRIAFVGGTETDETTQKRECGFTDRLAAARHELFQIEYGDYTFDSGREAAARLFSKRDHPDAIFCASDVMALGVLHAARHDFGLGAPVDFSLIGFDDIPSAGWPGHQLTSIRQPIRRMIRESVDILIERMENPELPPKLVTYPGTLIVRSTVRALSTE